MMGRLDLMTIVGSIAGLGVILAAIITSSSFGLFWSVPAILIAVGGSFFAVIIQYDFDHVRSVLAVARQAYRMKLTPPKEIIAVFSDLAKKARKEGLLALEDEEDAIDDPLFSKGLQLMVDAIDPETIRNILETEMVSMQDRHDLGQNIFRSWATLAPAFGMIGTLVGLIQMLSQLDDPSALGPGMSVALLTTFYGSLVSNLVMKPIAGKLALRSEEEMRIKKIILEGVIAIQSGMNPRILEEQLKAYVPPDNRKEEDQSEVSLDAAS